MSSMYTQLGGVISSPFGQVNQNLFNPGINQIGSPFLPQSGYGALSPLSGVSPFPSYPQPPAVVMPSLEQQYASFFRAGGPTSSYRPGPGLDPIWTGTPMTAGVKSGAPTGLAGSIGTKTTTKKGNPPGGQGPVTGKKGTKTQAYDPYASLINMLNHPPPAYNYTPSSSGFPKPLPLTNKEVEGYIRQAEQAGNGLVAQATSYYNAIRSRVANSPDMTARAKKEATDWINAEIRVINKQQDQAIAGGKRNAQQILSATGAAAQLQKSFGDNVGKSYADAAGVLATLGQGVGAAVTGAGNADLAAVGRVAPGALPASIAGVPAGAGSVVSTLGGALPAQNLAMQAAGVDRPGYVTGGAQNIVNQNAGLIQGAGGLQSIGAQRAGVQAAADLNSRIWEAQAQYGPLFHQIYGDLTSHQDAVNSQLMSMAQGGLTNAFQQAGRLDASAQNFASRYAANVAQINANALAAVQHQDMIDSRNQNAAIQASNQAWQHWSTTLSAGITLTKAKQDYEIAKMKAQTTGGRKPMTEQAFTAYTGKYMNAFRLLSGAAGFSAGGVAGNWGDPSTARANGGKIALKNAPVKITEGVQRMYEQFGSLIGGPKTETYNEFMGQIKAIYGVPNWTNAQVLAGKGPIPTSDGSPSRWSGPLPLNPLFTKNGQLIHMTTGKEEDHDPTEFDSSYWDDYFSKHKTQYHYIGPAEVKSSGGGGGGGFPFGELLGDAAALGFGGLPGLGLKTGVVPYLFGK